MRTALLRLSLIAGLIAGASALVSGWSYLAFEQVAVTDSVSTFSSSKITPSGLPQATTAGCRLETAEIRWTIDGTTPTSTVGTLLEVGDWLPISGHDAMVAFQAIRTGGTSGQLDCTYSAK